MGHRAQKPGAADGYKSREGDSYSEPSDAHAYATVVIHRVDPLVKVISIDASGQIVGEEIVDGATYYSETTTDPSCHPPTPGALTINQLATHLGVNRRTIVRMVDDGQIPYLTIRSQLRFHLPDVISKLTKGGPHAPKKERFSPRPAHGPVQKERKRTALLEHPEDGRWANDLCSAGHDAQGRGHHPVPRGDDRGWTRISVRRPLGEKK